MTARTAPYICVGFGDLEDGAAVKAAFKAACEVNALTQAQLIRELLIQAELYQEPRGVKK